MNPAGVCCDSSKAFDSVGYNILLNKLSFYSIKSLPSAGLNRISQIDLKWSKFEKKMNLITFLISKLRVYLKEYHRDQ